MVKQDLVQDLFKFLSGSSRLLKTLESYQNLLQCQTKFAETIKNRLLRVELAILRTNNVDFTKILDQNDEKPLELPVFLGTAVYRRF